MQLSRTIHIITILSSFITFLCSNSDKGIVQTPQFSYDYTTEIAYNNQPGFALDPRIENIAHFLNGHLNNSILFDSSLIRNAKKAREHHTKKKTNPESVGELYKATTSDGTSVGCTFFNRESDTLLIVGGGFTNEREAMSPFIDMFPNYDIVLFDFRGHGYRPFSLTDPSTWPLNLSKTAFGVDTNVVTLGKKEHNDVFAVVQGFKKLKNHRRVFGLGICYGAFIFAKAASIWPTLFDKIVFDGCWLSLNLFVDKVKGDLKTMCNPQSGGWSDHWFWSSQCVKNTLEFTIANIFSLKIHADISLLDFAPKVKNSSLLFFHGKNDYMVKRNEFEKLWNAFDVPEKTGIITSNPHVLNHLKQKELYKLICDLFFECSQERFIDTLSNVDNLINYHTNKLQQFS